MRTEADARVADMEAEAQLLRSRLDERARSAETLAKSLAEVRAALEAARNEAREQAEKAAALKLEHGTLVRARTLAEEAWEQVEAESHKLRLTFERRVRELEAELAVQRGGPITSHAQAPMPVPTVRETAQIVPPRSLTLVEPARRDEPAPVAVAVAPSGADPQLELYVGELIDQLKTAYAIDLSAGLAPTAIVDRLMANVRSANDEYARESSTAGADPRLLDRRLTELIDREAATSFGRHLAVALYVVGPDQKPGTTAS